MIELLKQTLEALKDVGVLTDREWRAVHKNKANELRQTIAELESQKPVAWKHPDKDMVFWEDTKEVDEYHGFKPTIPLYTHPPQRTWVGMTEDDKVLIKHDANFNQFMAAGEYADRVQQLTEARLKDKNT